MKKIIIFLIIFILFSIAITSHPIITLWDENVIMFIQKVFKSYPLKLSLLLDCKLYLGMIILAIAIGVIFFIKKKMYKNLILICFIPLIGTILNFIIKPLIHRLRPPSSLQMSIHPDSFSYVSTHTLITFCVFGYMIYLLNKYCSNKILKYFLIGFCCLWILLVPFSRIYLGVHYPSDTIGAILLGAIILSTYIKIIGAINE